MGALDWTIVSAAVIAGMFSLLNTVLGVVLYRQVRPPSGGKLGQHVENATQTAQANNLLLRKLNGGLHGSADDTKGNAA